MTDILHSDREFCTLRGAAPGSVFFLTHWFAPPAYRDRLLVLQALLGEIRSPLLEVSDLGVALAKFAWWGKELAPANRASSQQPVVRAANRLDLFAGINEEDISRLVAVCADLAQCDSMTDRSMLLDYCGQIGGAEIRLLSHIGDNPVDRRVSEAMGTALILDHLSRNLASVLPGETWWVPMKDQARLGLSLADVRSGRKPLAVTALARELGQDMQAQLDSARQLPIPSGHQLNQPTRVMAAVLRRRAGRLMSGRTHPSRRPLPGEMWAGWRAAIGSR